MGQKVVRAVNDLGISKGATGPHLMECDDGKTYVVKFAGPDKVAVNEFVGQALARILGLPVPEGPLIEVDAPTIGGSRDLKTRGVRAGLHQGSELVKDGLDLSQLLARSRETEVLISSPEVLPRVICHDNWVLTRDRDRDDNHLFRPDDVAYGYVMVDFSHGFTGPAWTADSIEQGSYTRVMMPVNPVLAAPVTGLESFNPALGRIEGISDDELAAVVSAVPDQWGLTPEERGCLVNFLELRRGLLRGILLSGKDGFPGWTNGSGSPGSGAL